MLLSVKKADKLFDDASAECLRRDFVAIIYATMTAPVQKFIKLIYSGGYLINVMFFNEK